MGKGEKKMKAKIAGAFVALRGVLSLIIIAMGSLGGAQIGTWFFISFVISVGTFFSGLGVLIGSTKAYFAAVIFTTIHLVFFPGGIFGIVLDVAVIGALYVGYGIQNRENVEEVKRY